ncbi:MAG: hypothetical protein EZS28_034761 [Streblomastix strix]|uniref:Uncharacterized protein n=1 Tax=Streblomastix strix TaxID=222440 RepID=A0A5J4UIK5_9EUKA|nr:MAG: hypothetical protein EZS28_034761 [Streblomastix strix]
MDDLTSIEIIELVLVGCNESCRRIIDDSFVNIYDQISFHIFQEQSFKEISSLSYNKFFEDIQTPIILPLLKYTFSINTFYTTEYPTITEQVRC